MTDRSSVVAVLAEGAEVYLPRAEEADMIELRLDLIHASDPLATLKAVRAATSRPIIATARIMTERGQFQGREEERADLLVRACAYADFVDVELQAPAREEIMARITRPAIVSYHDFKGMPGDGELAGIYGRMKDAGASIAKIAVTPASLRDNLRILQFLLDADRPLCMIAMGDLGRHMRVVAPLYGSALTYAYVAESTAPGQMSLADLRLAMRLLR